MTLQNIKDYRINALFMHQYRIEIMNMLLEGTPISFRLFKDAIGLTDGNLASHMRALKKGGAVMVQKKFISSKPVTYYRITGRGRIEFLGFKRELLAVLSQGLQ